jgi:hypothetical protein
MRAFWVVLSFVTAAIVPAGAQTTPITVTVNGTAIAFDQPPIEWAGRVFVPLRGVFERLGASVVYQAGQINATKDGTTIALRVGSTAAIVNGQPLELDNPPFVRGARTLVPLRFIAQALGSTVSYVQATQTVAITEPPPRRRRVPRLPQGR